MLHLRVSIPYKRVTNAPGTRFSASLNRVSIPYKRVTNAAQENLAAMGKHVSIPYKRVTNRLKSPCRRIVVVSFNPL